MRASCGAGRPAQPRRRQRHRPLARRRLDRRDLQQRARPDFRLGAIEQPALRGAQVASVGCRCRVAEKARRAAVLVLAEHGGADDDDPTVDRRPHLRRTFRRGEAVEQGRETVGRGIGERCGAGVIRSRSIDDAWRMLRPAPMAAKPSEIRPPADGPVGAALRTRPSDSSRRSSTPIATCAHGAGEDRSGRQVRKAPEYDPLAVAREGVDRGCGRSRATETIRPGNRRQNRRTPRRMRSAVASASAKPVDQAGPDRLKQRARESRQLGAG